MTKILLGPLFIGFCMLLRSTDVFFRANLLMHFLPFFLITLEHMIGACVLLPKIGLLKKIPKIDQLAIARKIRKLEDGLEKIPEQKLKGFKNISRIRVGRYRLVFLEVKQPHVFSSHRLLSHFANHFQVDSVAHRVHCYLSQFHLLLVQFSQWMM